MAPLAVWFHNGCELLPTPTLTGAAPHPAVEDALTTKTAPTHSTTTYTTTTAAPLGNGSPGEGSLGEGSLGEGAVAPDRAAPPQATGLGANTLGANTVAGRDASAVADHAQVELTARSVTLFSSRPAFRSEWAHALRGAGLEPRAALPSALPELAAKDVVLVIDAGTEAYGDEDELLAHIGLARALGALPVVALPFDRDEAVDEMFDDLCQGMVTRRSEDIVRIAGSLARRADASAGRRFEFLTVSPRGGELLAIFSDGSAVLVDRDALAEDDGSQVEEIALEEDAMRATLKLESGVEFTVSTSDVMRKSLLRGGGGDGEIDGVRLGQRIRELRLAAGLTQAELARRTGIHRPNIARVEAGRHTPSLETLSRLANAIGVPTTRVLD